MLSKEQIEQIVQMTIAQMNNQQPASAPTAAAAAGNGWMFDRAEDCIEAAIVAQRKLVAMTMDQREKLIRAVGAIVLLGTTAWLLANWGSLPVRLPSHYGFGGEIDGW